MINLEQNEWWQQAQENDSIILDVRTPDEFMDGMIPGAINIDIYKGQGFIYEVENLDKSKPIFVYCAAGGRSAQACQVLDQLGFNQTHNLLGGFSQWELQVAMPE